MQVQAASRAYDSTPSTGLPKAPASANGDPTSSGNAKTLASGDVQGRVSRLEDRLNNLEGGLRDMVMELRDVADKETSRCGTQPSSDAGSNASNGTGKSGLHNTTSDHINRDLSSSTSSDSSSKAAEGASGLYAKASEALNTGYIEAVRRLRDMLLVQEWDLAARTWARRRGVADFEQHVAVNCKEGMEKGIITYEQVGQLYEDPSRLQVIKDPALRMLARSFIEKAEHEQKVAVYSSCHEAAKEMGGLLQGKESGGLFDSLKKFLPLPAFLK